SSRRRHTRFSRDWSSDVCSSDLVRAQPAALERLAGIGIRNSLAGGRFTECRKAGEFRTAPVRDRLGEFALVIAEIKERLARRIQIGRASCRERGRSAGGGRRVEQ